MLTMGLPLRREQDRDGLLEQERRDALDQPVRAGAVDRLGRAHAECQRAEDAADSVDTPHVERVVAAVGPCRADDLPVDGMRDAGDLIERRVIPQRAGVGKVVVRGDLDERSVVGVLS